jgi:hypothetical protein
MLPSNWREFELQSNRRDRWLVLDPQGRPPSRKMFTKLRWFLRAAANFQGNYKATLIGKLGPDGCPYYVCPICLRAFGELALYSAELTFEDVPPKAIGGRPLVLTCSICNTDRGSVIDAAAADRERSEARGRASGI